MAVNSCEEGVMSRSGPLRRDPFPVLLFKGVVGCGLLALACAGALLPQVGIDPSADGKVIAAAIGAGIGAILALKG